MNCPECRKKLWYWAALSRPSLNRGLLVYLCQSCNLIIAFDKFETPSMLPSWRGVHIMRIELSKRGYILPPSTQRGTTKASPPPAKPLSAHPSKRGGSVK